MIRVFKVSKNKIVEGHIKDISPGCWIDCLSPSKDELEAVSKKIGIPEPELARGLDADERPKVVDGGKYSLVIFRAPYFAQSGIRISSFAMFLSKDYFVTVGKKNVDALEEMTSYSEEQKLKIFQKGLDNLLYEVISSAINSCFKMFDVIEEELNFVEHEVMGTTKKSLMMKIFDIKKSLIFFHKALNADREVIIEIEKGAISAVPAKKTSLYMQHYYDVTELLDLGGTYQDIMSNTLQVYLGSISNNLNDVMKKLTVYASFILIPTLIATIYGMNFKAMPEIYWKYGYFWALGLMAFTIITLYIYFKKHKWI